MITVYRFLSSRKLKDKEVIFKDIWKNEWIDFEFVFYDDLAYISWLWLYHIDKWVIENTVDWVWITWNNYLDFKHKFSSSSIS